MDREEFQEEDELELLDEEIEEENLPSGGRRGDLARGWRRGLPALW